MPHESMCSDSRPYTANILSHVHDCFRIVVLDLFLDVIVGCRVNTIGVNATGPERREIILVNLYVYVFHDPLPPVSWLFALK